MLMDQVSDSTIITLEQQKEMAESLSAMGPNPVLIDSITILRYVGRYDRIYLRMPGDKLTGSVFGSVVMLSSDTESTKSILTEHPLIVQAFGSECREWAWWEGKLRDDPSLVRIKEVHYWTPIGWHDQYEELRMMDAAGQPARPGIFHPKRSKLAPMRPAPSQSTLATFESAKDSGPIGPVTQDAWETARASVTVKSESETPARTVPVRPPPKGIKSTKGADQNALMLAALIPLADSGRYVHRKHIVQAMETLGAAHPTMRIKWPYFITQPEELRAAGRRGWFDISTLIGR
jgi:hypothetical protein